MAAGSVGVEDMQRGPPGGAGSNVCGQDLGEQARAAHAHEEDVVDALDEALAARLQRREVVQQLGDDRDPSQPVGDLGGVVAPEGVVAGEQAAHGVAPHEVGGDGIRRLRDGTELGEGVVGERHDPSTSHVPAPSARATPQVAE